MKSWNLLPNHQEIELIDMPRPEKFYLIIFNDGFSIRYNNSAGVVTELLYLPGHQYRLCMAESIVLLANKAYDLGRP